MKKLNYKIVEKISHKNISIKENLTLVRTFQKIINPIHKNSKYEDIYIPLEDRKVRIRVFNDFNDIDTHKMIFYIHGGGWVSGDIDYYTNLCNNLSKRTNQIVLLIDYRLAPENPFPCGFNDCYEIAYLLMKNTHLFNLKPKDITIMGDSAGGNLTAAIQLKARKTKDFKFSRQILFYPALQNNYSLNTNYKSVIENGKDYLLTRKNLEEYMNLYVIDKKDLINPYVSPLCETNFKHMPKTLIITAELDPLRDEGRKYAEILKEFKNKVIHIEYDGAIHGFMTNKFGKRFQKMAIEEVVNFLGDESE